MISLTADIHFENWADFSKLVKYKGLHINSRLRDTIRAYRRMQKASRKAGSTLHINLGDIFERRGKLDAELYNLALDTVEPKEEDDHTIIVPGNHDFATKNTDVLRSSVFAFKKLFRVEVIEGSYHGTLHNEKVHFWFVPYYDNNEDLATVLRSVRKEAKKVKGKKYLFAHAEVKGATMNSRAKSKHGLPPREFGIKEFDTIFLGHFHHHQVIAGNIVYVGALTQHNFGDVGQRRGFILLNELKNKWKHVRIKSPRFHVTEDIEKALELDGKGHFVRFRPENSEERERILKLVEKGKCRIQLLSVKKELDIGMKEIGNTKLTTESLVELWVNDRVKRKKSRPRYIERGLVYLKGQ